MRIAASRAAPGPFFRIEDQVRLRRIILYVTNRFLLVLIITRECIEISRCPKRTTTFQKRITLSCRVFFPGPDNLGHWYGIYFEQNMHMIGHDAPGA